jgi:hypothetical protein
MHVRMGVMHDKQHRWIIVAHSWARNPETKYPLASVEHEKRVGHLATLMHEALDEYERRFVFTPDELAQIQKQGHAA